MLLQGSRRRVSGQTARWSHVSVKAEPSLLWQTQKHTAAMRQSLILWQVGTHQHFSLCLNIGLFSISQSPGRVTTFSFGVALDIFKCGCKKTRSVIWHQNFDVHLLRIYLGFGSLVQNSQLTNSGGLGGLSSIPTVTSGDSARSHTTGGRGQPLLTLPCRTCMAQLRLNPSPFLHTEWVTKT